MASQTNGGLSVPGNLAVFGDSNIHGDETVVGTLTVTGKINGVSRYLALITQASTSAPTVTVIYSNLSAAITWTRTSAGLYVGTLTGEFTANKTAVLITGDTGSPAAIVTAKAVSANAINIKTWDTTAGTPAVADGLLAGATVDIWIVA